MQNEKRKKVLAATALLGALAVGASGTLAYLTDNESHTNTFTVGDVKVNLLERNWNQTDEDKDGVPDAAEDLVPNQEVAKDPSVKNEGINDAVVFVRVTVPVKDVTLVDDDGTIHPHAPQEIFYMKDSQDAITLHANNFDANWIELSDKESNKPVTQSDGSVSQQLGQRTYVFGYKTTLKGDKVGTVDGLTETAPLFDKVQLKNIIENEISSDQIQNMKIETWAIQSDNILNANGIIGTSGEMDAAKLGEIYDIYVEQNVTVDSEGNADFNKYQDDEHGQVEKEADKNNTLNLKGDQKIGTRLRVSINKNALNANANPKDSAQVTVTIPTQGKDYTGYTLSSSDESVATVDASGLVTPVGIGDCTITATSNDGAKASVHVSVQKDSRAVKGNDPENDASNKPQGTSEPAQQQGQQP